MNDRYLYRAKRIDDGEWVEGNLLIDTCGCFICDDNCINNRKSKNGHYGYEIMEIRAFEIDPSTICQCTGAPCKNTKMIYENDIVKYEDGSIGIIKLGKYGVFHTGLYVEWVSETAMGYRNELGYWAPKVEVVGNIFDNPELLE